MSVPIEDVNLILELQYKRDKEKEIRQTMKKIYIVDFCDNEGETWEGIAYPTIKLAKKKAEQEIERIFCGSDKIVCEGSYATNTYYKHDLLESIDKYNGRKYDDEPYIYYIYDMGVALRIGEFPLIFNIE